MTPLSFDQEIILEVFRSWSEEILLNHQLKQRGESDFKSESLEQNSETISLSIQKLRVLSKRPLRLITVMPKV